MRRRAVVACTLLIVFAARGSAPEESALPEGQAEGPVPDEVSAEVEGAKSRDPIRRYAAAVRLGAMGPRAKAAIPALIEMLDDYTQLEWIPAGGTPRIEISGNTLRSVYPGSSTTNPSNAAAESLAQIGTDAVSPLRMALQDRRPGVRVGSLRALRQLKDPSTFEDVVAALHDQDRWVRNNAAESLGKWRDPRAVEDLIQALRDPQPQGEPLPCWQREVAVALADIASPALPALTRDLAHADPCIRDGVAFALRTMDTPESLTALAPLLEGPDRNLRREAALYLGKKGDPRALDALGQLAITYPAHRGVKEAAIEFLGGMKDARAFPALETVALGDRDGQARRAALEALHKSGDPRALATLIRALDDKEPDVRASAIDALGALKDDRALLALVAVLKKDESARFHAIPHLGRTKDRRAISALIPLLRDKSAQIRRMAAQALQEATGERSLGDSYSAWMNWWKSRAGQD